MNTAENQKRTLLLLSGFWLFSAIYYATQPLAWMLIYGSPFRVREMIASGLQWLSYIPLSLYCLKLPARHSLRPEQRRESVRRLLRIGLVMCFALFALDVLSFELASIGVAEPPPFLEVAGMLAVSHGHTYVLIFLLLTGLAYAIDYFQSAQAFEEEAARQAVHAAELQRDLADARLRTLRMQLQPHFLFNAHHAITGLMLEGETDKAVRMLVRLSDLLRMTLDLGEGHDVTLRQEIALLRLYLEIQHIRFGDRLRVEIAIDECVLNAAVPSLILQPLVENAVRHGIDRQIAPGWIRIAGQHVRENLVLTVENSGPPSGNANRPVRQGIGLSTTRARLQQAYGDAHAFSLTPLPQGGMRAELSIPFLVLESAAEEPTAATVS